MKKIVLLLTILLGLTLVGCQKDDVKQAVTGPATSGGEIATPPSTSGGGITPGEPTTTGGGITPTEKHIFTTEEVAFFNTRIDMDISGGVSPDKIKDKNVNQDVLSYKVLMPPNVLWGKEVKKINNVYLLYQTIEIPGEKYIPYPTSALDIKGLFECYEGDIEYFSAPEETAFRDFVHKKSNDRVVDICAENLEMFEIQVLDTKKESPIYIITIWINKGKYIALDETGIIATKNSLADLLADTKINSNIDKFLM